MDGKALSLLEKKLFSYLVKKEVEDLEKKPAKKKLVKKADFISGGKADNKKPSDFDKNQLEKGIKVEMEHTDDKKKAKEIAMDHLEEFDNYYDELEKMENKLKKESALNKTQSKTLDSSLKNKGNVSIKYKKKNGRTVRRTVTPQSIRNGLLVGYDHKRQAIRSYKLDGISDLKKVASLGLHKYAGGPGSGVIGDNTEFIPILKTSPLISIGYRAKFFEDHKPVEESSEIEVSKIKYKGQEKMVPKKVIKMLFDNENLFDKPIKVIRDENGDFHIADGHHRALTAIILKKKKILADIYEI